MSQQDVITADLVRLDVAAGAAPRDVIRTLAGAVADAGRASDAAALAAAATAREERSGTGVPGGVAIPHCRSEAVTRPTLAFARLSDPVDFGGPDGPADLVFLIAAPDGGDAEHLTMLSGLARALLAPDFRASLRGAEAPQEIVDAVGQRLAARRARSRPDVPADGAGAPVPAAPAGERTRIVAVTACPTGVAHTYMAADALADAAARRRDVEFAVEPQGSAGGRALDPRIIAAADAVILATDIGVRGRARFAGKPVVESGVTRAVNEPDAMIAEAVAAASDPRAARVAGGGGDPGGDGDGAAGHLGWGARIRRAVMTGVSYMVPFVAAAGLLMALGFLLGGFQVNAVAEHVARDFALWRLPTGTEFAVDGATRTVDRTGLALYLGSVLFATGSFGMSAIVPVLSAFIAFGLAGRPGIAPGFIGGAISLAVGAGFLGGLVSGLVAGVIALGLASPRVPRWLASLMPVVVIPLVASLAVGLLMYLFLGRPLTWLMTALQDGLSGMSGTSAVLLGVVVGLMMCFDLGGPVNKAAYLFATAGLSTGDAASMAIMAAVMAAGMVPPLAMALASAVRPGLFTPAERENGKAGWLLGLSFISEGAIPFAAADPLRVIPSMMAGGAVTGALSMALGAESRAPHGGVFVLFAVGHPLAWLLSIAAGAVVGAACVSLLKAVGRRGGGDAAARPSGGPGAAAPAGSPA